MNKYEELGERELTDTELERLQKRIDDEELLENLKADIKRIKYLIEHESDYTKEELIGELKWIVE